MEIKDLKRQRIDVPEVDIDKEMRQEKLKLAKEATAFLGYDRYAKSFTEVTDKQVIQSRASAVFEKVGIEPFEGKSVAAYKKAAVKRGNAEHWLQNFCNSLAGENVMFCSFLFGGVLTALCIGTTGAYWAKVPHRLWYLDTISASILIFGGFGFSIVRAATDNIRYIFKWKMYRLGSDGNYRNDVYTDPIPEFALAHAVALKKELPSASFYVDQLQCEEVDMKPDPFLVMEYMGTLFYVDVWEEPSFEARKIV